MGTTPFPHTPYAGENDAMRVTQRAAAEQPMDVVATDGAVAPVTVPLGAEITREELFLLTKGITPAVLLARPATASPAAESSYGDKPATPLTGATEQGTVDSTLAERGNRYGKFSGHADLTQNLKDTMRVHDGWNDLNASQREALEMIAHKIGRILNGDPNYADSWHDIAGYAKLVDNQLNGKDV